MKIARSRWGSFIRLLFQKNLRFSNIIYRLRTEPDSMAWEKAAMALARWLS